MTHEETLSTLSLLRASYPAFYSKLTKRDLDGIVSLWIDMFADDDVNIVKYALKELIATHTGYPPDIAALKSKMKEIVAAATNKPAPSDLWAILKNTVEDGWYGSTAHAQRQFDKLPTVLKRFVGSPATLVEYSQMSADIFNSVIHSQFLRQIDILQEREEYAQTIPAGVKRLINAVYTPLGERNEDGLLTDGAFNKKRDEIIAQLDAMKGEDDERS